MGIGKKLLGHYTAQRVNYAIKEKVIVVYKKVVTPSGIQPKLMSKKIYWKKSLCGYC